MSSQTAMGQAAGGPAESTEVVVGRHLQAFLAGDVETIMRDFANDALLCSPDGPVRGRDQIRGFFQRVLPLFPPGATKLDIKQP